MQKTTKKINLQAEELSCSGCALDVETILRNTDGILDAKVNYATRMISIEYDPSEIEGDMILSIVINMGLKIRVI